jgi:hypothetical protein
LLTSVCVAALSRSTVGSSAGPEGSIRWPLFKWAGGQDDKYFARITKGAIKVYQAPEMTLLDKKDLKLEGVLVRGQTGGRRGFGRKPSVECCCDCVEFGAAGDRRVELGYLLCHSNTACGSRGVQTSESVC